MNANQEKKIIAQMIQELSLFLMFHGYKSYDIGFKKEDDHEVFTIKIDQISDELLTYMKDKLHQEREKEIEAYYWELLGDMDSTSELEIMGLFIDEMNVKKEKHAVLIELIRHK
jgi:hypothetical protein